MKDEGYFEWLIAQVDSTDKNPEHTHHLLLEQLHLHNFIDWIVDGDDNRAADGRMLRDNYCDFVGSLDLDIHELNTRCTFLEMLVAFVIRMSYETEGLLPNTTPGDWFWQMMKNLGIAQYNDEKFMQNFQEARAHIYGVVRRVNGRLYHPDGSGGLFPLKHAPNDQRKIELWYQFNYYVQELNVI